MPESGQLARTFLISLLGLVLGFGMVFGLSKSPSKVITPFFEPTKQEIVGFLPYWLVGKADKDYTKYLTTLTYFGISIAPDGSLVKLAKPGEEEPGWYTLESGKVDPFLNQAKDNNMKLSLLVFSGDQTVIEGLISDPASHAATLVSEVTPIMKQYGFTDLNLDIESVRDATPAAQAKFVAFVREVRRNVDREHLGTITIDSSPTDLIRGRLINPAAVAPFVDRWVLMTYDFHYPGSAVTGPVAPVGGAGITAEFDTETGIQKALVVMPAEKVLLGTPLYGYEWETVGSVPRSAVIPGTGAVASNRRMEEFVAGCATCSAQIDPEAKESYVVYKDQETGTFHQVFYPEATATRAKIDLVDKYQLGGMALWALGYDGGTIFGPLSK